MNGIKLAHPPRIELSQIDEVIGCGLLGGKAFQNRLPSGFSPKIDFWGCDRIEGQARKTSRLL